MADVRVFRPKSLGVLLRLYARSPEALLYGGGTALGPRLRGPAGGALELPAKVIYLGYVAELSRISRTQRSLDIGATLSLARIMSVGRNVLPKVLHAALASVATPSVRNLATLGGQLCSPEGGGDALPALAAVGALVELRSLGSARWLPASRFVEGLPPLRSGEVVCRVRVPLEEWDFQVYRKLGHQPGTLHAALSFAGVARLPKGTLESLHCSFGGLGFGPLPGRELEARLKNARLPLTPKAVEGLLQELRRQLPSGEPAAAARGAASESGTAASASPAPGPEAGQLSENYRAATALRLLRWFLDGLSAKSLETL